MFKWLSRFIGSSKGEKPVDSPEVPSSPKEKARKEYADCFIGEVTHFYSKIGVGIIKIEKGMLHVGDTIYIQGNTTRFKQKVASIEHNHQKIQEAGPGYEVGIRLGARVREADDVYVLK